MTLQPSNPAAGGGTPSGSRRRNVLGCLVIVLMLVLAGSVFLNLVLAGTSLGMLATADPVDSIPEVVLQRSSGAQDKIVHLDLDGMITSFSYGYGGLPRLAKELRHAAADGDVKAIVLRINSPGGEVTASDTLFHEVKKANAAKPVIVYMDSLAASGGYYIACGARKIIASHTTLTGSIGVIMQSLNYRELFGKVGLEAMTFRSGDFKDTLSGSREMRADEKEYIQSLVMEMYGRFVGIVAEARGLDVEVLRTGVADGRVMTGAQALGAGLVDGTGYLEDAYALARQEAGIDDAAIVAYRNPFQLASLAGLLGKAHSSRDPSANGKVELDISERLVPRLQPGTLYYLMTPLAGDAGGAGDAH